MDKTMVSIHSYSSFFGLNFWIFIVRMVRLLRISPSFYLVSLSILEVRRSNINMFCIPRCWIITFITLLYFVLSGSAPKIQFVCFFAPFVLAKSWISQEELIKDYEMRT